MKLTKYVKDEVTKINKLYHKLEKYDDIETLHQYRVKLRKIQAFTKIYSKKIDEKNFITLSKLIKTIIKPTSKLRDLDVFLSDISLMTCSLQTINSLHNIIRQERNKALKKFLHIKNSHDYKKNLKQLQALVDDCKIIIDQKASAKIVKKLDTKMNKEFYQIDMNSSLEDLHAIRKKFKTLRYGIDIHNKCFKSNIKLSSQLHDLKTLQDLFGAIQDNNIRLKFVTKVKNRLKEEEYSELKNYFEKKIYNVKKDLFKSVGSFKKKIS